MLSWLRPLRWLRLLTGKRPAPAVTDGSRGSAASSSGYAVPPEAKRRRLGGDSSAAAGGARPVREFKVVLVGDGGVGKTTFARRHLSGEFVKRYMPTLGVEVHSLRFETTSGPIVFNIWDTAGQETYGGLRDGYYVHAQGAIVMFDVTSRVTYDHVPRWHQDLRRACGSIPTIFVGNKVEVGAESRAVPARDIAHHRRYGVQYFDMSSKSGYNAEKPLLALARALTGDSQLRFAQAPAKAPAIPVPSTLSLQAAETERQLRAAQSLAVGDDDDDDSV